jgi:hypothetical protein
MDTVVKYFTEVAEWPDLGTKHSERVGHTDDVAADRRSELHEVITLVAYKTLRA